MKTLTAALAAAVLSAGLFAAVSPSLAATPDRQCFRMSEMRGWKATPDSRGLYYRVGLHDVYYAELQSSCPMLRTPASHLVNKVTTDLICSPIEFDLRVSDNIRGFPAVPCLVKSFHKLSPEEAKALPPKLKP
jgi:hypothetical protein